MLIILFSLPLTQNYMFLLYFYQQETNNLANFLAKDLKDQFIGMNIKEKVRLKIQQLNADIFLNQILLESIDYLI